MSSSMYNMIIWNCLKGVLNTLVFGVSIFPTLVRWSTYDDKYKLINIEKACLHCTITQTSY